jgi:hypothetical protein
MVLYRRHTANASPGPRRSLPVRVKQFLTEGAARRVYRQAEELDALFGPDLSPSARATLERVLAAGCSFPNRLRYALRPDVARKGFFDNLLLRGLLVSNRL